MRHPASIRRAATLAVLMAALQLTTLSALSAPLSSVKLRLSGREIPLKTPALFDQQEVYVPLEALRAFGGSWTLTRREETALVTLPGQPTVEIALARPGREPMLPLSTLTGRLKLEARVQDGVCELRRPGEGAKGRGGERVESRESRVERGRGGDSALSPQPSALSPDSRLPTHDSTLSTHASAPQRPESPDGPAKATPPPVQPTLTPPAGTPAKQTPQESSRPVPPPTDNAAALQRAESPDGPAVPGNPGTQKAQPAPANTAGVKPPASPVRIQSVEFEPVNDGHARVRLRADGKTPASVRVLSDPSRLVVDLPNSTVESEQRDWAVSHPLLNGAHLVPGDSPNSTRMVLDTPRIVSYRLVPERDGGLTLNLGLPRSAGRRMQDLMVVVDPGHGGSAWGCYYRANGACTMEKDLTLSIARKTREKLEAAGAHVLMTRDSDVNVGLPARPGVANQNGADLFVSIHIDECPGNNSASGTTTYFHMDDPSSRALAQSIVESIASVSGLPNRRARTDRERFVTGMAVLRHSQVPATLVEVGYINNPKDRARMVDAEFQDTVAEAIAEGIRAYVEGGEMDTASGPKDTETDYASRSTLPSRHRAGRSGSRRVPARQSPGRSRRG